MLPTRYRRLADLLRQGLKLNKTRAVCVVAAIATAIDNVSVLPADIADHLPEKATAKSNQNLLDRKPEYGE